MVPNFSILGRLPMPLPTGFCSLTGPNQVINFLVLIVHVSSSILFLGYDKVIQDRINLALDKSARFRKQLDGFLATDDAEVEIEEGMSYLSLVILLPLFLHDC